MTSPIAPTAAQFVEQLVALSSPGRPTKDETGFRAGPGDRFLAVAMRDVFALAKSFIDMPVDQIEILLESPIHEVRAGAVSIMDFQARRKRTSDAQRRELFELYLRRHDRIDTWDLVDRAAPHVVGGYLADKPRDVLYELARSPRACERRTAIVSTYFFIRGGDVDDTFGIAELLVDDDDDLVQKAVGGWIREAGKRDSGRLLAFLDDHAATMPRTALRYAVEKLDKSTRAHYMQLASLASDTREPRTRPQEKR